MLCHLGIIVYISQRYAEWANFLFYSPLPFGIPSPLLPANPRRVLTAIPLDVSGFGIGPLWQRAVASSSTPFRWGSLSRGWLSSRRSVNPLSGGPPRRLPILLTYATPIPSPQPAHIAPSARQLIRKLVHPFSDQLHHSASSQIVLAFQVHLLLLCLHKVRMCSHSLTTQWLHPATKIRSSMGCLQLLLH